LRWLALALVVGFFVVHDGANFFSAHSRFSPAEAHYVLQGLGGAILAGCLIATLARTQGPSRWLALAVSILVFWVLEQAEITLCPLFVADIAAVPPGMGLCTYATGIPFGRALMWIEGVFIAIMVALHLRSYLRG
jgi:hypothetical protein